MRLVIERNGTFDVHECSGVRSVSVVGDVVELSAVEEGGRQYRNLYKQRDAEAARRMARAIAVRCGVLVEPSAEQPGVVTEPVMFDGGEVITPPPNPRWEGRKAGEWVAGEPPKDGRWYVVRDRGGVRIVAWCIVSGGWWAGESGLAVATEIREHMLAPISDASAVSADGASEWVQGEPPKDGRWYVARYVIRKPGHPGCVRWDGAKFRDWDDDFLDVGSMEHLPTPIPEGSHAALAKLDA